MSAVHRAAFERIKIEYQWVTSLLLSQATGEPLPMRQMDPNTGKPLSNQELIEAAIATANDAYALLLIANSKVSCAHILNRSVFLSQRLRT